MECTVITERTPLQQMAGDHCYWKHWPEQNASPDRGQWQLQQRLRWGRGTRKPVGGTKSVSITKRSRLAGPTILFLNRFQPLGRNEPYNGERNISKQKHGEILIRLPFHPRQRSNHYPSNLDLKFMDRRCARSSWHSRISQTSEWLPPSSNWNFFSKSSHIHTKKEEKEDSTARKQFPWRRPHGDK